METNAENNGKERCVCKVTRIRNPVCGSDGVTYDNARKLECHNKCEGTRKLYIIFIAFYLDSVMLIVYVKVIKCNYIQI